eukprot:13591372-Alexandrium_andersonii.AAC.1
MLGQAGASAPSGAASCRPALLRAASACAPAYHATATRRFVRAARVDRCGVEVACCVGAEANPG